MKMTLGQIQNILNNPGFGTFLTKVLPITASFELARLRRKLSEEMVLLQEKKNELIGRYAEKDKETGKPVLKEGGNVTIPEADTDAFNTEFRALLAIECELGVDKIKLDVEAAPDITSNEAEILLDIIELVQ